MISPPYRIGIGYDIHPFVAHRPLILGGVRIPHTLGLGGHSDADALCHAITDALLGACGLGDIGRHFPDSDPAFADADSTHLLRTAHDKVRAQGWQIGNLDANLITELPKLSPFISAMQHRLAEVLEMHPSHINIKAKTNERMDAVGAHQALIAQAIVLLYRALPEAAQAHLR